MYLFLVLCIKCLGILKGNNDILCLIFYIIILPDHLKNNFSSYIHVNSNIYRRNRNVNYFIKLCCKIPV